MSEIMNAVTTQAAPDAPAETATPTLTHYAQVAQDLSDAIDEMLSLIPSFVVAHSTTKTFVNSHQSFSNDFLETAIAAVEANPQLQGVVNFDVVEARDVLQFISAFRPMMDKLTATAKNLQFTINSRRANIGNDALRVYGVAKQVARDPQSNLLSDHVTFLKRDLGRSGKGGRKKASPAPTTPVSTTPTPSTGGFSV